MCMWGLHCRHMERAPGVRPPASQLTVDAEVSPLLTFGQRPESGGSLRPCHVDTLYIEHIVTL